LTPTFPTRFGPCDPAAKPGFLSWGCPKIAPPSYTIEESDSRLLRVSPSIRVSASRRASASRCASSSLPGAPSLPFPLRFRSAFPLAPMAPCRSLAALHSARPHRCLSALLRFDIAADGALLRSFRRYQPRPVRTAASDIAVLRLCCFPALPGTTFKMRTPIPIRVPPTWFLTTSTDYSSSTSRPYCRPLPILGFTSFPPVAKQNFPRCTCCPSKLSLRRQRRTPERIPASVGPRHRSGRFRPSRSPRTLPSHPFSSVILRGREPATSFQRKPRPQGLAPSSGPLHVRPFPAARARCSLGLVRFICPARPSATALLP